jgi:hypothetical protein
MPTIRLLPPTLPIYQKLSVNGRPYNAAPGAVLDCPDFDAGPLAANGYMRVGEVGPTSARPRSPFKGTHYVDTTLALIIMNDGTTWRNPITGASV